jgi:hypothetical protein
MKYILLSGFFLLQFMLKGQVVPKDLPKPVERIITNLFGKDELHLYEKKISDNDFISDKFFAIHLKGNSELKGYIHIGRVNTCRSEGCSAPGIPGAEGKSEYFEYVIAFSPALTIDNIRIYNYQASYGHEITSRGWLKQFNGFSGKKNLQVGKDIDGISGATISVHAITDDVQWKTRLLKEILQ